MALPKVTKRRWAWRWIWNKCKRRDAKDRASAEGMGWQLSHEREGGKRPEVDPTELTAPTPFCHLPKLSPSPCVAVTTSATALKQEVPIAGSFWVESVKFSDWECGLWWHKTLLWVLALPSLATWPCSNDPLSPRRSFLICKVGRPWLPLPAVCWVLIFSTRRMCSLPGT